MSIFVILLKKKKKQKQIKTKAIEFKLVVKLGWAQGFGSIGSRCVRREREREEKFKHKNVMCEVKEKQYFT